MRVADGDPIRYHLLLGEHEVDLNALLGTRIALEHDGVIRCGACDRATRRSFGQGYCYPCFRALARCDQCIVRPELCHHHLGTCREPDWGEAHCMRAHAVYLANSSGVKVGITVASSIPTRWIDQGASQAVAVLRVGSRRASGLVEVALKARHADRTDWRRMLRGEAPPVDLASLAATVHADLPSLTEMLHDAGLDESPEPLEEPVRTFSYPVLRHPVRLLALDPGKVPRIQGTLLGMKGQYLILDSGVINVPKFAGYELSLERL